VYVVSGSYLFNEYRLEPLMNARLEKGKEYILWNEQCSLSGDGRLASCYPKINVKSRGGCATKMQTENARPQSAFTCGTLLLSLMSELKVCKHLVQSLNGVWRYRKSNVCWQR
jgi:hypothetical protein